MSMTVDEFAKDYDKIKPVFPGGMRLKRRTIVDCVNKFLEDGIYVSPSGRTLEPVVKFCQSNGIDFLLGWNHEFGWAMCKTDRQEIEAFVNRTT